MKSVKTAEIKSYVGCKFIVRGSIIYTCKEQFIGHNGTVILRTEQNWTYNLKDVEIVKTHLQ